MSTGCGCERGNLATLDEVLGHLRKEALSLPGVDAIRLPLCQARGMVLVESVSSTIQVPPADNSAMDGYALRAADAATGAVLEVSQRIPAGVAPQPLTPGTCARIFTGAEIPPGADAVVMQEDTEILPDNRVRLPPVNAGENVRRAGQDIAVGTQLFAPGRRLQAADIGLLASIGVASVLVARRLRVAVLSSGDELVQPGEPLAAGQLYNSNQYTIVSTLEEMGFDVHDAGTLPDDLVATRLRLTELATTADVIVSSGGVSVGEEDHLKAAVEAEGRLVLWKLGIKPGKPLAFGYVNETPFIGLPGNPVAVWVTLLVAALPWLRWRQGESYVPPVPNPVPCAFTRKAGKRREYLRVQRQQVQDGVQLVAYPNQSSGVLSSVCWSHGLAWQEPGQSVAEGDALPFISYADWLA
ncbi:MAG TPA: molybdopterin molybdenumtransferase MoeA [Moraxellaceae bacterium]|nr:molybdopterin molybdenumtransferase MoeA [Moraxellaceae bacterium]